MTLNLVFNVIILLLNNSLVKSWAGAS